MFKLPKEIHKFARSPPLVAESLQVRYINDIFGPKHETQMTYNTRGSAWVTNIFAGTPNSFSKYQKYPYEYF